MEIWKSENEIKNQVLLSSVISIVGLILIFFASNSDSDNGCTGFFLGVLLFVLGLIGALFVSKQIVSIDSDARLILIEEKGLLVTRRHQIDFDEIADVLIGYIGKKTNMVEFYYLILKLKNGQEIPVFKPTSISNKQDMEIKRDVLLKYLKDIS